MDIIQGEKFISLADNKKIFYCHTHNVNSFFSLCDKEKPFILISHNSDAVVTDNPVVKNPEFQLSVPKHFHANINNIPDNCVRWFSQNVEVEHERLESIPIGFENNSINQAAYKIEKILNVTQKEKKIKNTIYLDLSIEHNFKERSLIYDFLKNKNYATLVYKHERTGFDDYLDNLYNHKFMVCPEGNGIDCLQLWESIYSNTIPIQKKNINNKNWRELPACWVDDWSQLLDINFLHNEYIRIKNSKFDTSKLHFEYWKNRILSFSQQL